MKNILDLTKNKNIYFISPHLDDAILSCGQLISHLCKLSKITIITVFTNIHFDKPTLSARQFIKQCGYDSPKKLQNDRTYEDKKTLSSIGCQIIHLGYNDALWRKKPTSKLLDAIGRVIPEVLHIYPTYRWHLRKGKISDYDQSLINDLSNQLKVIIPNNSLIFCPIAIGNHIDHKITKIACQKMFNQIIFWTDFPYNRKNQVTKISLKQNHIKEEFMFSKNITEKIKLINGYKSQIKLLFPNGEIDLLPEKYYLYHNTTK